jgi:hypothetical protein
LNDDKNMNKYTFKSGAMLGEMYREDGEEAGFKSGTEFYLASDVDVWLKERGQYIQSGIHLKQLLERESRISTLEYQLAYETRSNEALRKRIAELETANGSTGI